LGGRDRDRVAVVGHDVEHRQVLGAGGVQALPELPLGGGALAQADVGDLVTVGGQPEVRPAHDVAAGLGAADGRDALAAGRARLGDDVPGGVAPVGRHLPPAGGGVLGRADRLEQDLLGGDAEAEYQGEVAVVGEEPVVAGAQLVSEAEQEGLVAGAGDLEEHPALLLQSDLAVVDGPGDAGQEEVVAQLLGRVGGQPGGEIVAGGRVGLLRCLRPLRLLGGLLRRLRLRLGGLLRLLARLAPGLRRLLLRLRLARPAVLLLAVLRALAADGELGLVVGDRGDLRAAVAVAAVAGAGRLVAVGHRRAQVDDLAVRYRPHRLAPAETHLDPPGRFDGWLAPMVAHLTNVREGSSAICVPNGGMTARLARLTTPGSAGTTSPLPWHLATPLR